MLQERHRRWVGGIADLSWRLSAELIAMVTPISNVNWFLGGIYTFTEISCLSIGLGKVSTKES